MKVFWSLVLCCTFSFCVVAQDESEYDENYEYPERKEVDVNFGIGLGIDYGGLGAKLSLRPVQQLVVFGALGYNFNEAGYNIGASFRILPDKTVCPFIGGMYGYNAVLISDLPSGSKTYYGGSLVAGIELHRRNNERFWNFGIVIPFWSKEFRDEIERLDKDPNVDLTKPSPIGISVGYHFRL